MFLFFQLGILPVGMSTMNLEILGTPLGADIIIIHESQLVDEWLLGM